MSEQLDGVGKSGIDASTRRAPMVTNAGMGGAGVLDDGRRAVAPHLNHLLCTRGER